MEYRSANIGRGSSKVTGGIEIELNESYGQFCVYHMNSGRPRSQLVSCGRSLRARSRSIQCKKFSAKSVGTSNFLQVLPVQAVDATQALILSAGVSNRSV